MQHSRIKLIIPFLLFPIPSSDSLRGLAHSGEEGVFNVLQLLNDELALAMKLMGATTIAVS